MNWRSIELFYEDVNDINTNCLWRFEFENGDVDYYVLTRRELDFHIRNRSVGREIKALYYIDPREIKL